jgi:hypothetical protein
MRFLVAAGFAILIVAAAKTIDVLLTPFGAAFDPMLQLPYALSGYVIYGIGLALLFFTLAAHFALSGASPRLIRSRAALSAGAFLSGAVIASYLPWVIVMGLRWIIPEEQPRFVIVASVANLHLVVDGLLLMWLGLRFWSSGHRPLRERGREQHLVAAPVADVELRADPGEMNAQRVR